MLKINIFWAVFKKPLRMRHCFLFGPYFMPIFNGKFLKCDILPISNDPVFKVSRGRPTCFYCGKPEHFQKNCRHFRKDKEIDDTDSKRTLDRNGKDRRGPDRKGMAAITTSEEEFMLITEESEVNLAGDEMT